MMSFKLRWKDKSTRIRLLHEHCFYESRLTREFSSFAAINLSHDVMTFSVDYFIFATELCTFVSESNHHNQDQRVIWLILPSSRHLSSNVCATPTVSFPSSCKPGCGEWPSVDLSRLFLAWFRKPDSLGCCCVRGYELRLPGTTTSL